MKPTAEEQAILDKANSIAIRIINEEMAERDRKATEEKAKAAEEKAKAVDLKQKQFCNGIEVFRKQFPGIGLSIAGRETTLIFPNGKRLCITAQEYELFPGSCDHTTGTDWTIDFDGGEICANGNDSCYIPAE